MLNMIVEMVSHFLSFFIPQALVLLSCEGDITLFRLYVMLDELLIKWKKWFVEIYIHLVHGCFGNMIMENLVYSAISM